MCVRVDTYTCMHICQCTTMYYWCLEVLTYTALPVVCIQVHVKCTLSEAVDIIGKRTGELYTCNWCIVGDE